MPCSVSRGLDTSGSNLVAWKRIRDTSPSQKLHVVHTLEVTSIFILSDLPDCRAGVIRSAERLGTSQTDMWASSCRSAESDIACVPCLQKAFVEALIPGVTEQRSRSHIPRALSDIFHRAVAVL